MKKGDLIASFITSISLGVIILGGSKLLNFFLKIIVSRLGVSDFGDYYLTTATFLGLTTVAALGVPMSVTRFISFLEKKHQPETTRTIITSALVIMSASSCVMGVILYIFADGIGALIQAEHAAPYLRILSFGFIGSTITLLARAILLGLLRIRLAYLTEAIDIVLRFIFTIIGVVALRWGVIGALIGYTTGTILAAIVNLFMLIKISVVKNFTPHISIGFFNFTLPVSLSEILTAATNIVLLYIIRAKGGGDAVGLYGAAISVAALIHILPQMMLSVFLPAASREHARNKPILPLYKSLMLWLGIAVLIPSGTLLVFGSTIISALFGSLYKSAVDILIILVIAHAVYAIVAWPNRQLLDMAGHTRENLLLTALRISINIGVLFFSVKNISGLGLATAILWGWVGESAGSVLLVRHKKLL